jgi:hypothetical protein
MYLVNGNESVPREWGMNLYLVNGNESRDFVSREYLSLVNGNELRTIYNNTQSYRETRSNFLFFYDNYVCNLMDIIIIFP